MEGDSLSHYQGVLGDLKRKYPEAAVKSEQLLSDPQGYLYVIQLLKDEASREKMRSVGKENCVDIDRIVEVLEQEHVKQKMLAEHQRGALSTVSTSNTTRQPSSIQEFSADSAHPAALTLPSSSMTSSLAQPSSQPPSMLFVKDQRGGLDLEDHQFLIWRIFYQIVYMVISILITNALSRADAKSSVVTVVSNNPGGPIVGGGPAPLPSFLNPHYPAHNSYRGGDGEIFDTKNMPSMSSLVQSMWEAKNKWISDRIGFAVLVVVSIVVLVLLWETMFNGSNPVVSFKFGGSTVPTGGVTMDPLKMLPTDSSY